MTKGYRGYIGSRPYAGIEYPQYVQNFLIRNYCVKNSLTFLLSATEYRMPGCFMILEEVVASLESLDGIVLFSIFLLPEKAEKRRRIYDAVLGAGKSLHGALESIAIRTQADADKVEEILGVCKISHTDESEHTLREFCAA